MYNYAVQNRVKILPAVPESFVSYILGYHSPRFHAYFIRQIISYKPIASAKTETRTSFRFGTRPEGRARYALRLQYIHIVPAREFKPTTVYLRA